MIKIRLDFRQIEVCNQWVIWRFILVIIGKGRDLNNNERTTVRSLIIRHWIYDQNQLKHKGRSLTLKVLKSVRSME